MRTEAKAKIQASASRNIDQYCHRGNQPMHITVVKAQAQTTKNLKTEEFKARDSEPLSTIQRSNNNKLSDKAWKEKKKEQYQRDRKR